MCSIRNLLVLMLVMLSASAGCQLVSKKQPLAPVNNTPLVVDEAMQIRDWDRSTNYYANGATVAGGTGYCFETADWVDQGHRRLVDAPVALLNFAAMPVGLFVNSPFERQVLHGEIVPPTYTGQPPLPGKSSAPAQSTPTETETPAPVAEPGTPPPAPPAVETPPESPTPPSADTPQPLPPPVTPAPPTPQPDPITPETLAPPPSAVEPAPPVTPAPPAPPAPTAEPLNK